jgi:hypothetical protein
MTTTEEILAPKTILKAVSQLDLPGTTLSRLFGWGFGGRNVVRQSGRKFAYDILNPTRTVATGRVPGDASSRREAAAPEYNDGDFPRSAEIISLLDENLLNRREIGLSPSNLDIAGQSFITHQEIYLAQRFANLVEFQTAAMMRGSYVFVNDGDDLRHGFTGTGTTINFRVPAENLTQLNMLGGGNLLDADWEDPATDIPGQLQNINAAMVQLTGLGLSHVVLTGSGWQKVLNNEKVQQLGGSANVVFESLQRVGSGEFTAVLRALPWITFHVVDYGLNVWDGSAEVFTKLIEDDHAAFFPQPSSRWVQYLEGSEIVTEGPGGAKSEQFGFYAYGYPTHDPSGWDLAAVFNGIPALYTPNAMAYGLITGGSYS